MSLALSFYYLSLGFILGVFGFFFLNLTLAKSLFLASLLTLLPLSFLLSNKKFLISFLILLGFSLGFLWSLRFETLNQFTVKESQIEFLKDFRENLKAKIDLNFSGFNREVLLAILLGFKEELSDFSKLKLNFAGLRHITAISGLHFSLLFSLNLALFLALGFWRQKALIFSLILSFLYLTLTGFQIPTQRAFLFFLVFSLSYFLGIYSDLRKTLVLVAFLLLIFNPSYIQDISFQFSFLATFGILAFKDFFKEIVKSDILALTLSAQTFILPLIFYYFGYFSLFSLIANLLVIPFLPLILALGILFLLGSYLSSFLAYFLSLPLRLLLDYLNLVATLSLKFPEFVLWIKFKETYLIFSYLLLFYLAFKLEKLKIKKYLPFL